ncbi:MAG TPA: hypothetical protein VH300_13020 [Thermoleophilaceae bacterium]|jgi:exopolyphosphatase/guanosine-5'-triphosphate,3'-diphosphate pyrophosphatase|nr:hypothetical protein [Thermoleophilaceae bacterium]
MTIVPRWEWRTFGDSFGAADDRFDALPPERIGEGDDVYLLSGVSEASVKVRDGLMDVKRLEQVRDDGLEQWRPVMKASFPLGGEEVNVVLEALGVEAPRLGGESYSLDDLLIGSPEILALKVHKRREHYTIGGCMAERTELRTENGSTRTVAVESEDPERVLAAVRELGLDSRRNVSVPRGLKALAGVGAPRYAVVDVGTNSIKFHIGGREAGGQWRTVVDRAEVTRLGEGLDETGKLGEVPIERSVAAIAGMADEARQAGVVGIAAVGTAGLRAASNAAQFVDSVRARCGIDVEIILGEEEGRLAYLAATAGLPSATGSLVVFDTGGGSSQFTFSHAGQIGDRFSLKVGAVRYTERFRLDGAVPEDTLASAVAAIGGDLAPLEGRGTPDAIVALGGAVTNMAAVKHELATYDHDVVQGTVLDREEIDRQIELYRTRSAGERRDIVGLQPGRAEVILAGACIVRTVLSILGRESLSVSDYGLRHGLLVDRFGL